MSPTLRRRDAGHAIGLSTLPPLLARLYAARGVTTAEEAEPRLAHLLDPRLLGGLDDAVALLREARSAGSRVVVVGDFDCDGATGTAVAVRGLRMLGFVDVHTCVPHRMVHGYGLSPALVEDELRARAPGLVITVDAGIACHAGVAAARAIGAKVLVTDHHLPGEQLPMADAIVNPNLPGDAFPSKALAGVGVVFYLLLALRAALRADGDSAGQADLASLLDLVAIGTVADLVPLDANNRRLVAAGLARMRRGQCQAGVRALAEVAGKPLAALSPSDIGFSLGPRLNAAGRLEDMTLGIECLLTDDGARALALAQQLDQINAERRALQADMVDEAEAAVQEGGAALQGLRDAWCVFQPHWHPGVVGLVASKLKERLHRPVVAFAPAEPDGEVLRGSARSIPGVHVRDVLAAIDARQPGLLGRFGGHAMAAGLSLARAHLPAFALAFEAEVARWLGDEQREAVLWSDGELPAAACNRETAELLHFAGPWGQGFPEPVFDGVFEVLEWRVLAERHLKLVLSPGAAMPGVSAIHFGGWRGEPPPSRLRIAYQLGLDDFRGRRGVQLLVREHWPVDD